MKAQAIPRTGIVDALSTGLTEAARRPWLWVLPILVDLVLWLAPKLSVTGLMVRLLDDWKKMLPLIATSQQMAGAQEAIDFLQSSMVELGEAINLGMALTAGWLAPPSALVSMQATRYLLISDAVLGSVLLGVQVKPLGPSASQGPAIEIGSVIGAICIVIALWAVSHLLTALYFRLIAQSLPARGAPDAAGALPASRQPVAKDQGKLLDGWLALAGRFAVVSLIASLAAFMIRLPLALVTALALVSGSGMMQFLFILVGGFTLWFTLWFLSSLFFMGDALAFDRQPLWPSLIQSLTLMRVNGLKALVLAAVVNLIMLGARAVWGFIGTNPLAAVLAIVVNAYLATAMVIGIYIYYQDLRRHWHLAQVGRQLSR